MKAHLFVLGGPLVGHSFDVDGEAVVGRAPSCDVRVGGRGVSRKHARVYHDGLGWFVEDLGSRNGVKRQGERIEGAERLEDHDEILLGEVPLRFRLSEEDRAPTIPDAPAVAVAPAPSPAPVAPPRVTAPPPVTPPQDDLGDELELEEEIVLEEDFDAPEPLRPGAQSEAVARRRTPVRVDVEPQPDPERPREAPPSTLSSADRRRAEILAEGRGRGLLRGDLSQQPMWVRFVVSIALVAALVGLVWLVFRTVTQVRGTL